jgi:hypothetical protein
MALYKAVNPTSEICNVRCKRCQCHVSHGIKATHLSTEQLCGSELRLFLSDPHTDMWTEPGSSVSVVSVYRLGDRGSIPGSDKGFFLWLLYPDKLWGPPSLVSNGYWGSFPEGKARPGRDAVQWPRSSAEVKMSRSYTSTPCHLNGGSWKFLRCYIYMRREILAVPHCGHSLVIFAALDVKV